MSIGRFRMLSFVLKEIKLLILVMRVRVVEILLRCILGCLLRRCVSLIFALANVVTGPGSIPVPDTPSALARRAGIIALVCRYLAHSFYIVYTTIALASFGPDGLQTLCETGSERELESPAPLEERRRLERLHLVPCLAPPAPHA